MKLLNTAYIRSRKFPVKPREKKACGPLLSNHAGRGSAYSQTLVKKDLENSLNDKTWAHPSHYPGEVFFIPRPGAVEEDDGVVVTIVFDGVKKQSYLLLLDGKTFSEINLSYLPYNVPFSFHGNWFPELH